MVKKLVSGSVATFAVSFASLVLIARLFPLDFIADAKAVTVYGGWFSVVLTFQVHSAYLYFHRVEHKDNDAVRAFTFLFLAVAAALAALAFFLALPFLYDSAHLSVLGRAAFGCVVGLNLLFGASPTVYTAEAEGRGLPRLMLLYPAASLVSLLIAWNSHLSVNGYALALLASSAAVISMSEWRVFLAFGFRRPLFAISGYDSTFGLYARRIFSSNILENLGDRLDKVLVGRLLGTAIFARYSVVCFENPIVGVLLNSYGLTLVKRFQGGVEGRADSFLEEWQKMIRVITTITFPMSLFLAWQSNWFIATMFGPRFVVAGFVLKVYLLVSLLRYAPFQALLRLQGAVQFNVLMASGFLIAAGGVGLGIVAWGGPWEFMALSYLAGWLVFNVLAVHFFRTVTGIPWRRIVAPGVWMARVLQCAAAIAAGEVIGGHNPYLALAIAALVYACLVLLFDSTIRGIAAHQLKQLPGLKRVVHRSSTSA